jgi:hypothetical protein
MGSNVAGRAAGFEGRVYRFSRTHGFMAVQARLFFRRDKCAGQKKEGRQKEQKEYFSFHNFSILSENVLQINQKGEIFAMGCIPMLQHFETVAVLRSSR